MDIDDYQLDGPNAIREEDIVESKIFVAKSTLSNEDIFSLFEQEKVAAFKGFFKRPKEQEVVITSVKKSFEPYLLIGGRYELRYLTERTYDIDLLDNTESVLILGQEIIVPKEDEEEAEIEVEVKKKSGFFDGLFSSKSKSQPTSKPEIQLKGVEHVHIAKEIMEVRSYSGSSINPEFLQEVDLTRVDQNFLQSEAAMVPSDYIDMDKLTAEMINEYTKKPEDVQRVLYEKLTITDRKILFYPVFWAEMVYKNSKQKIVRLDAITKHVEVPKGKRYAPPPEVGPELLTKATPSIPIGQEMSTEVGPPDIEEEFEYPAESPITTKADDLAVQFCPECGSELEGEAVFCSNCGVKVR